MAQRDLFARIGIDAQHLGAVALAVSLTIGERARIRAFGIIGAADEGAIFAELQRQLSCAAGRAGARIRAIFLRRENMWRKELVEAVEHLSGAQILGRGERARKIRPEMT